MIGRRMMTTVFIELLDAKEVTAVVIELVEPAEVKR